MQRTVKTVVWDIPTRVFHWTLALSFAGAWVTSTSDEWLGIHVFLGYLVLAMVVFRVIWGFIGTHYARFAAFPFAPKAAINYLRDVLHHRAKRHIGHNPAGSLAIYGLLGLALAIGVTGILTLGGEEQHGIAAGWLSFEQGEMFKEFHEGLAVAMLLLVLGHVMGVVVESVLHRENLARSMVTGIKLTDADDTATPVPAAQSHTGLAVMMCVTMLGFGGWWFTTQVPFVGAQLPDNAQWREECGSCHVPYYPALLPSRSWERVMAEQGTHFGTDLGLDAATSTAILGFLQTHSAEKHATEAGYKIDRSLQPHAVPLRITETPYWRKKHEDIQESTWKSAKVKSKANCDACHSDAKAGTFEDGAMQIPQ